MTNDLSMGHTIASDGNVYLIDDTENNRVLIMEKMQNNSGETVYVPTQEFTGIGNRPHYIIYDDYTDTFYAWEFPKWGNVPFPPHRRFHAHVSDEDFKYPGA